MKKIILIILIISGIDASAQFYTSNTVVVGNNGLIAVTDMDFENNGDFSNNGEITIRGNFINSGTFSSNAVTKSRIILTSDWTNNLIFAAGKSDVIFNGTNQTIGGLVSTIFNILDLKGVSGNIKTLQNNSTCADTLFLGNTELASNGFELKLNNGLIPVQRTTGYISTLNNGIVKINFPTTFAGNYEIPLGFGTGASQYKPVFLVNPANDSFGFTLFGNSPINQGMDPLLLQDSLCSINPDYYFRIKTFGSQLFYGITKTTGENYFTKLGRWDGTKWTKISNSGQTGALAFNNLSLNSQGNLTTENISQAHEKPFVFAGDDIFLDPGKTKTINTTGYFPQGSSILWSPSTDLSCSDCPDPILTMANTGVIVVEVSNGAGCSATDTVNVYLRRAYEELMPTVFSPNGDKVNDEFGPVLMAGDKLADLEIFNRHALKIYKGSENWDGTYKDEPVMQGVYIYKMVILADENGSGELKEIVLRGEVTLFR